MKFNPRTGLGILVSLFLLSACKEKIIVEIPSDIAGAASAETLDDSSVAVAGSVPVPASSNRDAVAVTNQSTGNGIVPAIVATSADATTPVPANGTTDIAASNSPPDADFSATTPATTPTSASTSVNPSAVPATADYLAIPQASLSEVSAEYTIGEPGIAVDCALSLPCRWLSADQQFAVTLGSADNIASRGRLRIEFQLNTLHDSDIALASAPMAATADGQRYRVSEQVLGSGNGISPIGTRAAQPLFGSLDFEQSADADSLVYAGVLAVDNGLIRNAEFSNIPVGPQVSAPALCEYTLPCSWESADQSVLISLISVGGYSSAGRLIVNATVTPRVDMTLALDSGTTATASDGTLFTGRTHAVGNITDYKKISHELRTGVVTPVTFNFSRNHTQAASLLDLNLMLYEDSPSPRWNSVFTQIPVQ